MSNKINILLIVLIVHACTECFPQTYSNNERRLINLAVYELIDNYKRILSSPESPNMTEEFLKLFTDDALVYCDITPENRLDENITPQEYIEAVIKHFNNLNFSILNLNIENPDKRGEEGLVFISFSKVLFRVSTKYYLSLADSFKLNAVISFRIDKKKVSNLKFVEINPQQMQGKFMFYKVTDQKNRNLENVKITVFATGFNQTALTDERGTAFMRDIPSTFVKLTINDPDFKRFSKYNTVDDILYPCKTVLLQENIPNFYNPNEYNIRLIPKKMSLGFQYLTQLSDKSVFHATDFDNSFKEIKGLEFKNMTNKKVEFIFGYNLLKKKAYSLKINSGIGIHKIAEQIKTKSMRSELPNEEDGHNASYVRIIELTSIDEIINLSYYDIPAFISNSIKFSKRFSITLNTGIVYSVLNSGTYTSSFLKAQYSGLYAEYLDLIIAEKGVYDYGGFDPKPVENKDINFSDNNFSFAGSFFITYSPQGNLFVSAGPVYTIGTKNLIQPSSQNQVSRYDGELNTTLNIANSVKMKYTNLGLGLTYKF